MKPAWRMYACLRGGPRIERETMLCHKAALLNAEAGHLAVVVISFTLARRIRQGTGRALGA